MSPQDQLFNGPLTEQAGWASTRNIPHGPKHHTVGWASGASWQHKIDAGQKNWDKNNAGSSWQGWKPSIFLLRCRASEASTVTTTGCQLMWITSATDVINATISLPDTLTITTLEICHGLGKAKTSIAHRTVWFINITTLVQISNVRRPIYQTRVNSYSSTTSVWLFFLNPSNVFIGFWHKQRVTMLPLVHIFKHQFLQLMA